MLLPGLIAKHGGRTHGWDIRDHECVTRVFSCALAFDVDDRLLACFPVSCCAVRLLTGSAMTNFWHMQRHFIATLQRFKVHPEHELDWTLPPDKLGRLEEVLEDLTFRLPTTRDLEEDQPGEGQRVVREHFKWCGLTD